MFKIHDMFMDMLELTDEGNQPVVLAYKLGDRYKITFENTKNRKVSASVFYDSTGEITEKEFNNQKGELK